MASERVSLAHTHLRTLTQQTHPSRPHPSSERPWVKIGSDCRLSSHPLFVCSFVCLFVCLFDCFSCLSFAIRSVAYHNLLLSTPTSSQPSSHSITHPLSLSSTTLTPPPPPTWLSHDCGHGNSGPSQEGGASGSSPGLGATMMMRDATDPVMRR